jgi:hypothetical protein
MRSWLVLTNRCSTIIYSSGLQLLTGYGLLLYNMLVKEDKVLKNVKAAADPSTHYTYSKAATSSDTSFTPIKVTHPTLLKLMPTSSYNKGKAAICNINYTSKLSPIVSACKHY